MFNEHDGFVSLPYSPLHPARRNGSGKRGGSRPTISKRSICSESWRVTRILRLNLNFMPGDIQFVPNHALTDPVNLTCYDPSIVYQDIDPAVAVLRLPAPGHPWVP